jgi:hypothetical protein
VESDLEMLSFVQKTVDRFCGICRLSSGHRGSRIDEKKGATAAGPSSSWGVLFGRKDFSIIESKPAAHRRPLLDRRWEFKVFQITHDSFRLFIVTRESLSS